MAIHLRRSFFIIQCTNIGNNFDMSTTKCKTTRGKMVKFREIFKIEDKFGDVIGVGVFFNDGIDFVIIKCTNIGKGFHTSATKCKNTRGMMVNFKGIF